MIICSGVLRASYGCRTSRFFGSLGCHSSVVQYFKVHGYVWMVKFYIFADAGCWLLARCLSAFMIAYMIRADDTSLQLWRRSTWGSA